MERPGSPHHQPMLCVLCSGAVSQFHHLTAQLPLEHGSAAAGLAHISHADAAQLAKKQQQCRLDVLEALAQA